MKNTDALHISSIESLAAKDGPGLRYGVFLQGCPLHCAYCHNPETQALEGGFCLTHSQLLQQIKKYLPYIQKKGGVTFSGGEPLLQAKSLLPMIALLQQQNIHVAIDTSGAILNEWVLKILEKRPLILLDIKMLSEEKYHHYIGMQLNTALDFLSLCQSLNCPVWLRYVAVPTINDSEAEICALAKIALEHSVVQRIDILPYHTLGLAKYEALHKEYSLKEIPAMRLAQLNSLKELAKQQVGDAIIIG